MLKQVVGFFTGGDEPESVVSPLDSQLVQPTSNIPIKQNQLESHSSSSVAAAISARVEGTDSVVSPRSARFITPQQHHQRMSVSQLTIQHSRLSSVSMIVPPPIGMESTNPHQQILQSQLLNNQENMGVSSVGVNNTQVGGNISQNQSILSIITQANKEQLYVYCPTHTDYFITNICTHKDCIEPLCPECMISHNDLHIGNGTASQLQNIQSKREQAIDHISALINSVQSEYSQSLPVLERSAKESSKRNMESAMQLKAAVHRSVDAFFESIFSQLNSAESEMEVQFESLDAVVQQRLSEQSILLQELQSPLYIKALIETLENPTSVQLEQEAFAHIIDSIKEKTAMCFAKSESVDDAMTKTMNTFFSYQKKQKIFLPDSKGPSSNILLRASSLLSPKRSGAGAQTDDLRGSFNELAGVITSSRSQSRLQQMIPTGRSSSLVKTEPNIPQYLMPLTERDQGEQGSTSRSTGLIAELSNNTNKKVRFLRKKNSDHDQTPIEQELSAISGAEKQVGAGHMNNGILDFVMQPQSRVHTDFIDGFTEEDIIGYQGESMMSQPIHGGNSWNDTGSGVVKPISNSSRGATASSGEITSRTNQKKKLATVEEEHPSSKVFHVFVEGTKIMHVVNLSEYHVFPKSSIQTEFLDIHFKIPINHASIQVPAESLTLLTGGIMYEKDKKKAVRDVYRYDRRTNSLERMASMLEARSQHALVHVEGIVYAIGGCSGFDESSSMRKCEYFNVEKANWFEMPDCLYKASGAGVTVVNRKFIYKFGGKDDLVKPVNNIECYDIAKRIWHPVAFDLAVNSVKSLGFFPIIRQINHDEIIVAGGYQHSVPTQNVYVASIANSQEEYRLNFKEHSSSLPSSGIDFQYAQSFFAQESMIVLKNPTKLSVGDTKIFLVFNGETWNVQ